MLREVLKVGQIQAGRDVLGLDRDVCEVQGELALHTGRESFQAEGGERSGWEGERNISLAGWLGRYLPLYSGLGARKDCDCHQQSRSIKSGHQG